MSAFSPKADIFTRVLNVRYVPKADIDRLRRDGGVGLPTRRLGAAHLDLM